MNEQDLEFAANHKIYPKGSFVKDEFLRICSISGGKDSTALYCWMIEQFGRDGFTAVFADTGHEHPVTYNYVRNLSDMANGPAIHWVKANFRKQLAKRAQASPDTPTRAQKMFERNRESLAKSDLTTGSPFLDMWIWKGRAPSTKAQFCTEYLKLNPIRDWLKAERDQSDLLPIMYVGVRGEESAKRAMLPEEELNRFMDCLMKRPLLQWTESQVFKFLEHKGVPPNPLYGAGFSRVGCFPCIHARKSELAKLPDWAWEKLAEWEGRAGTSFFTPNTVPGVGIPTVADVRAWSKTARGGRQLDMLAEEPAEINSCMSTWGHCE